MTKFVHMELHTDDVEGAKRFYGQLLGWGFQDMPIPGGGTYTMFECSGDLGISGGITPKMMPGTPTAWLGYAGVKSAAKTTEKARALGATVVFGPQEIPQTGVFSIFIDPTGAPFAVWESLRPPPPPPAKKAAKKVAKKAPAKKAAKRKAPAKKAAKKPAKKKKR